MPHYFLCVCQSYAKNIFAKFHENIPNVSQEIEKNAEKVPPLPPPPLPKKKERSKCSKTDQKLPQNGLFSAVSIGVIQKATSSNIVTSLSSLYQYNIYFSTSAWVGWFLIYE